MFARRAEPKQTQPESWTGFVQSVAKALGPGRPVCHNVRYAKKAKVVDPITWWHAKTVHWAGTPRTRGHTHAIHAYRALTVMRQDLKLARIANRVHIKGKSGKQNA